MLNTILKKLALKRALLEICLGLYRLTGNTTGCQVGVAGARAFADALKVNATLTSLGLVGAFWLSVGV